MQVRAACQHRQRFVGRRAAHVRAEVQRVQRFWQKLQICSVGIVNEKYRAAVVAHFGKVSHIRHFAQIIGAGYIYGGRRSIKLIKCFLQYCRRHRAAAERTAALRPQPYRLYIKESRGIYKGLMYVAGSHDNV